MARSPLTTAPKLAVFINGKRFGRVSSLNWSADTPKRAVFGVDSMESFELAPTTARVTGSMTIFKLSGDGGAEGAGMSVPFPQLSLAKYFSMSIVEIGTNVVVFEALKCACTGQQWGIAARSYVTGNISFEAINFSGEAQP